MSTLTTEEMREYREAHGLLDTKLEPEHWVNARKWKEEREIKRSEAIAAIKVSEQSAHVTEQAKESTLVPDTAFTPYAAPTPDDCFIANIILNDYKAGVLVDSPQQILEWTFTGSFLKGTAGLLVAPPGTGKSTAAGQFAASIAMGIGIFGYNLVPERSGKVLVIFCEENISILQTRVYNMHTNLFSSGDFEEIKKNEVILDAKFKENMFLIPASGKHMHLIETSSSGHKESKSFKALLKLAKSIEGLELIILDPLSRLYGLNENDNSAATFFCSLLEKLAEETGASVLCVHHTSKGGGAKGGFNLENALHQDAIRGASAFTGAARWQLNMVSLPEKYAKDHLNLDYTPAHGEYIALKIVKSNHGSPGSIFYMKRGEGGFLKNYTKLPDTREEDAKTALIDKLVHLVRTIESSGDVPLTVTDLRTKVSPLWKKEEGITGATKEAVVDAANNAVEDGLLFWVTRNIKNAEGGRTAKYLSTTPE